MKILLSLYSSANTFNLRIGLIDSLLQLGHQVIILSPSDSYSNQLKIPGVDYHSIEINQKQTNLYRYFCLTISYIKKFKQIKPDLVLSFNIKPNIFGNFAAGYLSIPVVNNITGTGTLFIKKSFSNFIVKFLYRLSFRFSSHTFFNNSSDQFHFYKFKIIDTVFSSLVHGSELNTGIYKYNKTVNQGRSFLFVGRILVDKEIYEYLEAIKVVLKKNPDLEFLIATELEANNKTALSVSDLDNSIKDIPQIKYLGEIDDMVNLYKTVDVMVLPSSREGLSKSLIEAASMSLPLITTDVPDCKDIVVDGHNGFLCQPNDSNSLANAILKMSQIDGYIRHQMGLNNRKKVMEKFDEQLIISDYLNIIKAVGTEKGSSDKH